MRQLLGSLLALAMGAMAGDGSPPLKSDIKLSEVDAKLITEMYSVKIRLATPGGGKEEIVFMPCNGSLYGAAENNPLRPYFIRWRELVDATWDLQQNDPETATQFKELGQKFDVDLGL